jgi:GT2 family glycosyltransferase
LEETKKTVKALQKNFLASETDIYIFSDYGKNTETIAMVIEVRKYINNVSGFKSVTVIERDENYGLAKSIITGVSQIINEFGTVIVLEDDLITSKNFLTYMNQGLNLYQENLKVWSISGFSFPIYYPDSYEYDASFGVRASSWGWATWKDRWDKVDWEVSDYDLFLADKIAKKGFNKGGSDLCKMLNDQMTGKINSWAIRFSYSQFKNKSYDVFPKISKIKNVGFSEDATHTASMDKRFDTKLDETTNEVFKFPVNVSIEESTLKQFQRPFSIATRIKYKLLGFFK